MGADNPAVETITEGDQDTTADDTTPDTRTDEEILAEGNKDDVTDVESDTSTDVDSILPDDKTEDDTEVDPDKEDVSDEDREAEDDLEAELLSEEEQQIDDVVRQETPEYNDIKKKYPQFFKEFPGMRHTLFRMKAMDRIFTTVEEARSVAEKHDDLIQLEAAVLNGSSEKVLKGLQNIDAEAMEKFAEGFLPALFAGARPVHDRITGNVLSTALRVAARQARSQGNKNLYNAVGHMSQFLFGKDVPPEASRRETSPEIEAERERLNNERQQMYDAQARTFQTDVTETGERLLRKELTRGLDPQNVLPDFVKESIVEAAITRIGAAMDKDEAHLGVINNLWARAQRSGFDKASKAKLVAAWFGRAKSLAGPTRRKLVANAVEKATGKAPGKDIKRRQHVRTGGKGKAGADSFRPKSAREVDWNTTSDLDVLEGKAKRRGK
jgi:hypothetical protein